MDNIILFDDPGIRGSLLPFTFTRPVAEIRVGIMKISEKWEYFSEQPVGFLTQPYLSEKFKLLPGPAIMVNGALIPEKELWQEILSLKDDEALFHEKILLAAKSSDPKNFQLDEAKKRTAVQTANEPTLISKSWHIFQKNAQAIIQDFRWLSFGRTSEPISDPHTIVYQPDRIFVEKGAKIKSAILNAETGPIYIGKNTDIQEGAIIRGPFALCEGATVNMGAKMRGDTTIGPYSKIGGEVSNSVIFGFSNKGHDGFLGNAVLGEWCNLGADTNNSNLKNNYAPVKIWDYTKGGFSNTGLQFCGLMMGDHSKCGINTMFNTGTVVGVGANIFGDGFPRNFIPSFTWGGASGFNTYQFPKFEETAQVVMGRRGQRLEEADKEILKKVFELTRHYRIWEKEV